jgi:HD-GYP domain-containing protein (c-di-GMP phosphodiesterase class II)
MNLRINNLHTGIIKTLTRAIDAKDSYTRGHSERVACYALAIARALGLSAEEQRTIFYSGAIHDVGKIGVSENVLQKPDSLSREEVKEMQTHPVTGALIVSGLESLELVEKIIYAHHERYDGKGYPLGIKGHEIPLGARVISVVDAYDAMLQSRPYHEIEMGKLEAIQELKKYVGTQFDPEIVGVFIRLLNENVELEFNSCLVMALEQ